VLSNNPHAIQAFDANALILIYSTYWSYIKESNATIFEKFDGIGLKFYNVGVIIFSHAPPIYYLDEET